MKRLQLILIMLLCGMVIPSRAQTDKDKIETKEMRQVVAAVSSLLESNYVFPEVADKMNALLKENMEGGRYDNIKEAHAFADALTADLRAVSNDLHLRVNFDPTNIARRQNASHSSEDSLAFAERQLNSNRASNYGFKEVRILEGNIGYLNLTGFFNVDEEAGATAHAAMNLLANADALIIDLRQNGGGSPSMIQLITSYLYGPNRVHLNTFYNRPLDAYSQTWTLPYVPGKRRPDIDVYVLTSKGTFSAAEEFSYNLRNLERATLIGEVTGGGAHPGGTQVATERFTIWVPTGRAINPVTNTNWEGQGVEPHIQVPAGEALEVAKIAALEALLKQKEGDSRYPLEWALEGYRSEKNQTNIDEEILKSYVGKYGPREILIKEGKLYYQREGNNRYRLIPMANDKFMIKEIPYFRLKILKVGDKVVALQGIYSDGTMDKSMKHLN